MAGGRFPGNVPVSPQTDGRSHRSSRPAHQRLRLIACFLVTFLPRVGVKDPLAVSVSLWPRLTFPSSALPVFVSLTLSVALLAFFEPEATSTGLG
jgi:hypothetical protein